MIGRTFSLLGGLVSVMALSSLVYGAFQEPLLPYMRGIMGGVLDLYRLMRDYVFSGLGWACSGFINFISSWLAWLPPAPWFEMPNALKDLFPIYFLFMRSVSTWVFGVGNEYLRYEIGGNIYNRNYRLILHYHDKLQRKINFWTSVYLRLAVLLWPVLLAYFIYQYKVKHKIPLFGDEHELELNFENVDRIAMRPIQLTLLAAFRRLIVRLIIGALVLFGSAYMETHFGLFTNST